MNARRGRCCNLTSAVQFGNRLEELVGKSACLEVTAIADSGSGRGHQSGDLGQGTVDVKREEAAPAEILALRDGDPHHLTGQREIASGAPWCFGRHCTADSSDSGTIWR